MNFPCFDPAMSPYFSSPAVGFFSKDTSENAKTNGLSSINDTSSDRDIASEESSKLENLDEVNVLSYSENSLVPIKQSIIPLLGPCESSLSTLPKEALLSLSINEVVNFLTNFKMNSYQKIFKDKFASIREAAWKECVEEFTTLETAMRTMDLPEDWDAYEPAGGLKLSIDPDQINPFVQKKFADLRKAGLLLFRSEFEKQEDPARFRQPGKSQNDDLTRLWGAEYLREKLRSVKHYSVPRFLIVVENGVKNIPVTVVKDKLSLVISKCDTQFAQVVVEDMKNTLGTCSFEKHGWMKSIGYVDFADSGNIRQDRDGFYVVDTEWKSFEVIEVVPEALKNMNPTLQELRYYVNERCSVFYPESNDYWHKTVEVDLDNL